jgi:hypothetical protein
MESHRKWVVCVVVAMGLFLGQVPIVQADHPSDSIHDQALVPADCTACHEGYGIVTEHVERLSYSCSVCHASSDQDVVDSIYRGRYDHLSVYCAFCHMTENRSIRVHAEADLGVGHVEHDHATVPFYCRGCHGNDIRAVHIDPDENDLNVKLKVTGGLFNTGHAAQGSEPPRGTPAWNIFSGKVSTTGAVSYGNFQTDAPLELEFTGLDPNKKYALNTKLNL